MMKNISINRHELEQFCHEWKIEELSLFGSVLRDDFSDESDVDVLVRFTPQAGHSLLDIIRIKQELQDLLKRDVDLVEDQGLRNPFRRRSILSTREIVYAA